MSPKGTCPSQIQFHGEPGITQDCLNAIIRLVHFGNKIHKAALLTHDGAHCFILEIDYGNRVAVKSGFSSDYRGEGSRGLVTALRILHRHGADVEEYLVPKSIIAGIDNSSLSMRQLEAIDILRPCRPKRLFDYIHEMDGDKKADDAGLNNEFPQTLPYAIIDPRLMDLALSFPENPDNALVTGFRRLEDIIRSKARLEIGHGSRLFTKAFQGDKPILVWEGVETAQQNARAILFDAVYRAYRNPRAHREPRYDFAAAIREFLLMNELFLLESESVLG